MILVTGGTGLVGAHLLLKLTSSGENVRAIYRGENLDNVLQIFSYYHPKEKAQKLFEQIKWVKANILDVPALADAFLNVEYVYHCAALVSFNLSDSKLLRKINIEGTANVVNLCISFKVKKLCFVSSIATLNKELFAQEITEESVWNPSIYHSEYAISKYGAEIEIWRGTQEGVNAIIVNPGVILGPGFGGSATVFTKVKKGLKFHFPKVTGFVGVQDVASAMIELMESEIANQQFILVSENKGFNEILKKIALHLDKNPPIYSLKPWMIKIAWMFQIVMGIFGKKRQLTSASSENLFETSIYNSAKAKKVLSFTFEPLDSVIQKSADFYKNLD